MIKNIKTLNKIYFWISLKISYFKNKYFNLWNIQKINNNNIKKENSYL